MLAKIIANIFKEYGLLVSKITHVVTDGGSEFCKAFRVYGKRNDEVIFAETENLLEIDENDDDEGELNLSEQFMQESGEFFLSNQLNFENMNNIDSITNKSSEEVFGEQSFDDEIDENDEIIENELTGPTESIELPPQRRCA